MLVVKVYATKKVGSLGGKATILEQIDEIHIQNVGERGGGYWEYKVKKPRGVKPKIMHFRVAEYRPLLIKALKLLENLPKKRKRRKK